jgi:hypothetical protein
MGSFISGNITMAGTLSDSKGMRNTKEIQPRNVPNAVIASSSDVESTFKTCLAQSSLDFASECSTSRCWVLYGKQLAESMIMIRSRFVTCNDGSHGRFPMSAHKQHSSWVPLRDLQFQFFPKFMRRSRRIRQDGRSAMTQKQNRKPSAH